MAKRLKYTKEILTHMLNGTNNVEPKNLEWTLNIWMWDYINQ